jgi:hypothetical protein
MQPIEDHLRWRRALLKSLSHFAAGEATELGIHLGDLRYGFLHAIELIEQLASTGPDYDPEILRVTLAHLKGELFEHLLPHIHGVEPALSSVVSTLYQDAEERGEFD